MDWQGTLLPHWDMDVDRARYLASPEGRAALGRIPAEASSLSALALTTLLRRTHPPSQAGALAEQVVLRTRAREKLGTRANQWLLTRAGLEMMTHPVIAARRAARLRQIDLPAADLTCGIGGDLRAVAEAGIRAAGFDSDGVAATLAAANVPQALVGRADAARPPVRIERFAALLDPSRRGGRGRTFDPAAFSPPWDTTIAIAQSAAAAVVKAPPGIDRASLPPEAEVEFVQLGRVLRECTCWLGRGSAGGIRRAVLLPGEHALESTDPAAALTARPPGAVVLDPRSCVTRAGLVRHLAQRVGGGLMDPLVAYLAADRPVVDPFCDTFEVLDIVPFSLQRLRRRLRERRWSVVEVRRRAFPIEPDDLRRQIGRLEGEPVVLLCTTLGGRRVVFVAKHVS